MDNLFNKIIIFLVKYGKQTNINVDYLKIEY